MERGWNAWRALRARTDVSFVLAELPVACGGAVCARWGDGTAVIVIDPSLSRRERHEALAHELCHLERGGSTLGEVPLLEVKEEIAVRREVAKRCVPLGALRAFIDQRASSDLPGGLLDVAEEFDCTEELAGLAMTLLPPEDVRRSA